MMKRGIIILMLGAAAFTACQDNKKPFMGDTALEVPAAVAESWTAYITDENGEPIRKARGPMTGWFNNEVWMGYAVSDGNQPAITPLSSIDWGDLYPGQNNSLLKGIVVMGTGKTAFFPTLFYPLTNWVYLRGVYPREDITNVNAANPNINPATKTIIWESTGQQDIMVSNTIFARYSAGLTFEDKYQATKADPNGHPDGVLEYHHLLTRIGFQISVSTGWPSSFQLTEIEIRGIHTTLSFDMTTFNTLTWPWSLPDSPGNTEVSHADVAFVNPAQSNSIFTKFSPSMDVSSYVSPYETAEMAYMMFPAGETFQIFCKFVNVNDGMTDIIPVTNLKQRNGGADITTGIMQKGSSYNVHVNFRLVSGRVTTYAEWEEEILPVKSTGTHGAVDIGNLNPDENRWW